MEFVEGETLAQILARLGRRGKEDGAPVRGTTQRLDTEEVDLQYSLQVAGAFADVAEALQHAHEKGVIHRDIKPSNLILDLEGKLRILDFGLARLEGEESVTLSSDVVGTIFYMSPEQARVRREKIDRRTDIYSLGATLHEVLTRSPPFRGENYPDTLSQITSRDPVPVRKLSPRVPADLETIVLKCLEKHPDQRYGSAEALAQDLRRCARGDPIEARPQPRWERVRRNLWRSRVKVAIGTLVLLLLAAGGLLALMNYSRWRESLNTKYEALVREGVERLSLGQSLGRFGRMANLRRHWGTVILGESRFADDRIAEVRFSRVIEDFNAATSVLPDRPEAYYYRAQAFLALGDGGKALDDLGRALRHDPEFVPARVLRATIHERDGRAPEARADLEIAAGNDSAHWARDWHRARKASAAGQWGEADAALGEAIKEMRSHGWENSGVYFEALVGRGAARMELENYLSASRDFTRALHGSPGAVGPAILLGYCYLRLGDDTAVREAERWYEKYHDDFLRKQPEMREDFLLVLALVYVQHGLHRAALAWLKEMSPGPVRERARIFALAGRGRRVDAARVADKLLEDYDQEDPFNLAMAGYVWSRIPGESAKATALLDKASRIGWDEPHVCWATRWGYFNTGNIERSFACGLRAYELTESPEFQGVVAWELFYHGKYQEAARWTREQLKRTPWAIQLLTLLGRCHQNLGDPAKAEEYFRQATDNLRGQQSMWLSSALRIFGSFLEDQGRLREAEARYEEAFKVESGGFHAEYAGAVLVRLLARQGRVTEAWDVACQVLARDPTWLGRSRLSYFADRLRGGPKPEDLSCLDALVEPLVELAELADKSAAVQEGVALVLLNAPGRRAPQSAAKYARRAAELTSRQDPDVLATLAAAQFATGALEEAVLTLEEASLLPGYPAAYQELLLEYRRELFPRVLSLASIDSFFDDKAPQGLANLLRQLVAAGNEPSRHAYLEAFLLKEKGSFQEAAAAFSRLEDFSSAEWRPTVQRIDCLRLAGQLEEAREHARKAIETSAFDTGRVWHAWWLLSSRDLEMAPAEILAALPGPGSTSQAAGIQDDDMRWLLERLRDGESIRINCGGEEEYEATDGVWGRDRFFHGGAKSFKSPEISGTEHDQLYRAARTFRVRSGLPGYRIPLPRGRYRVTLHFAENAFRKENDRVFDVLIEGRTELASYDAIPKVGFAMEDHVEREIEVNDGFMDIELVRRRRSRHSPKIAAIEIERIER